MKKLSILFAAVLLSGCAAETGAPSVPIKFLSRSRVEKFIVKGKTTRNEVIAEFGPPTATVIMSNSALPGAPYETLSYTKLYTREVAVLTVSLNEKGIVTGFMFTGNGPLTNDVL